MARKVISRIVEQPHTCAGCRKQYQGFVSVKDGMDVCPHCEAVGYHPSTASTTYGQAPASDIQYNRGKGEVSHVHGCHPSEVGIYSKACPSLKVRSDGAFVMMNRTHYRRCLREMKSAGLA